MKVVNAEGHAPGGADNVGGKRAGTFQDSGVDRARDAMKTTFLFRLYFLSATICAFIEPILIAFPHTLKYQVLVLAISSILFILGQILTFCYLENEWKKEKSCWEQLTEIFDGEVWIEIACLAYAWPTLLFVRSIAALRCFRVFRVMWFFELVTDESEADPSKPFSFVRSFQLCLEYLEKLGTELFTAASKGGTVILAMFFYVSYLFAVVYYSEFSTLNTTEGFTCGSIKMCFITMLRLSFYDGTGFDFLTAVVQSGKAGYAVALLLYMCFAAMVLLNGLIGIFVSSFTDENDEDEDEKKEKEGDVEEGGGGKKDAANSVSNEQMMSILTKIQMDLKALRDVSEKKTPTSNKVK